MKRESGQECDVADGESGGGPEDRMVEPERTRLDAGGMLAFGLAARSNTDARSDASGLYYLGARLSGDRREGHPLLLPRLT